MKIRKLPRILALHLKRFKYIESQGRHVKLSWRVSFPLELRLFNTSEEAEDGDRLYSLFAMVVHIGSQPSHGHYVALVKSHGHWLLFDDKSVERVDESYLARVFGGGGFSKSETELLGRDAPSSSRGGGGGGGGDTIDEEEEPPLPPCPPDLHAFTPQNSDSVWSFINRGYGHVDRPGDLVETQAFSSMGDVRGSLGHLENITSQSQSTSTSTTKPSSSSFITNSSNTNNSNSNGNSNNSNTTTTASSSSAASKSLQRIANTDTLPVGTAYILFYEAVQEV